MERRSADALFGFGGVHAAENDRALRWGSYFEIPMLLVALWIIVDWYMSSQGMTSDSQRTLYDWLVWSFFLVETAILCRLCDQPLRHLKRNWSNVAIILLGFPPLFDMHQQFGLLRLLRMFFLVGFVSHNFRTIRNVLSQNNLGKTLVVAVFFITGGGILIAAIDPAITNPADGIWWAWVTVTTVGYGDVVPVSATGRVFASLLILTGITLVSLITANVSAYLLSRSNEKKARYEQQELKKLLELEERIRAIEKKIDHLIDTTTKK
ncbi:MAG: two pore domain potassium channel family protein [Ketobacter sp.]|nr:MAG: two pore domain potassium channel family protein [Ketobacter sp.]